VVGYAFRDHWMWFNGYSYLSRTFNFIIWKDYNCVAWITADNSAIFAYPASNPIDILVSNAMNRVSVSSPYNDIWGLG
jgi:hypothetical protein